MKHRYGAVAMVACMAPGYVLGATDTSQTLGTYSLNPTVLEEEQAPGFYADLELDLVHDDNIRRTDDNIADISSMILEARPELLWIGAAGKHTVRIGYQGYYGWYQDSSSDDFNDHFLGADVTLDLTQKFSLNLTADYRREHEYQSVLSQTGSGPDLWRQWAVAGEAVYGRRTATAQVAMAARHWERDHTNHAQEGRDYDADELKFTFFYNLGPKTQLLVEPSYTRYDYTNNATQDNDVLRLLAGVTWEATAKTTGEFKIGHHTKDFDTGESNNGLSIEGIVTWEPKTYSTVQARLSRYVYDSSLVGNKSYQATIGSVEWVHELTALTEFQTGIRYEMDEYDTTGREDKFTDFTIGLSYALKRWLTLGVRYDYARRDSNVANQDYVDNRFAIGVKTSFK